VLSLKEQYYLLFDSIAVSEEWRSVRHEILSGLLSRACDAVSLLAIGVNLRGWQPAYNVTPDSEGFTCIASAEQNGERVTTEPVWSSTKVKSQQLSAAALCYLLCGEEAPLTVPAPPSAPASAALKPTVLERVRSAAKDSDFISAIFLLATSSKWARPRFAAEKVGERGEQQVSVTCTVRSQYTVWTGAGEAATEKEARQAAAHAVWEKLQEIDHNLEQRPQKT
jgi:hypothetical protein